MLESMKNWTPANKRFLVIGLTLTICAQMLVLGSEYLISVWPLWFGTPVILKTAPVDPRSLFRGNYVRLGYDISRINRELTTESFKRGEVGYVTLREEEGVYVATGLYRERPDSGLFIRGRVNGTGGSYWMNYGIEAYFMPKEKAMKAQGAIRQGASAEVYLLNSGKAAISKLSCKSGDC